jgi:hypothetical protein
MFDYNSPMKEMAFEKYMKQPFTMQNIRWMLYYFVKKQSTDKVKQILEKTFDEGNNVKMTWRLFMLEVIPFLLKDKSRKDEYVDYALRLANEKIHQQSETKDLLEFITNRSNNIKELPNSFFEVCDTLGLFGGKETLNEILDLFGVQRS